MAREIRRRPHRGRQDERVTRQARARQAVEVVLAAIAGGMERTSQAALDMAHMLVLTADARVVEASGETQTAIRRASRAERSADLATVGDILDHWAGVVGRLLAAACGPATDG